jgi:hypothetical protein
MIPVYEPPARPQTPRREKTTLGVTIVALTACYALASPSADLPDLFSWAAGLAPSWLGPVAVAAVVLLAILHHLHAAEEAHLRRLEDLARRAADAARRPAP